MKRMILLVACFFIVLIGCEAQQKYNLTIQKTSPQIYLNGSNGSIRFYDNIYINQTNGLLTVAGANLSVGSNNLLGTGTIGLTGSRFLKAFVTDIESTNSPTVGGVPISSIYAPISHSQGQSTITSLSDTLLIRYTKTQADSRYNIKLNKSDTSVMLTHYAKNTVVSSKLNKTDTTNMLSKYIRKNNPSFTYLNTNALKVGNGGNSIQLDSITSNGVNIYFYTGSTLLATISGGGAATWGAVSGTITNQTDLVNTLNLKASLLSPTFTGTPVVPGYVPTTRTINSKPLSGNISLTSTDVGLGNVVNESKTTMFTSPTITGTPIISGYVPNTRTVNGHVLSGNISVTTTDLVLNNVNNTSDANKPISTATQTELNLKAYIANPTFTTGITTPQLTLGSTLVTATGIEINKLVGLTASTQEINNTLDGALTTSDELNLIHGVSNLQSILTVPEIPIIHVVAGDTSSFPIPERAGIFFIDTSGKKAYISVSASRRGWIILN